VRATISRYIIIAKVGTAARTAPKITTTATSFQDSLLYPAILPK